MSWELASFLLVGVVLIGGFAWYERSAPPSQVVALVAALAALAIAGRIAFAAFPNVKPTTDIIIFAGYALGPAAGFAVGALSALVSNFWFGQGPWTPWQMAAWGLCGVIGAALALGVRNVGRLTLAAVCGIAGLLYGAVMNFSLMATYGGELSLRHFLLLEVRAVPFEAAHVSGNIVFVLLAGPAMVRMLVRFRERFEWGDVSRGRSTLPAARIHRDLRGGGVAMVLLVAAAVAIALPSRAQASETARAASWLEGVQNANGGYGAAPGEGSNEAMTGWAMLGLEAAGRNPLDVSSHGHTPVDFLRSAQAQITSTGDLARTILALGGAGIGSRSFAGRDLVAELAKRQHENGSFEDSPSQTAFSVIALRSAGASGGLERSVEWLRDIQNSDGGWGDTPGVPSTADNTGAVLQTLAQGSKAADRGLSFLRGAQQSGGGFAIRASGGVNSQSTAWAIQGILAVGGDPSSYRRGGVSAPGYLSAQQESDGHYRYSGSSNQTPIWATGQVLVAAAGDSLPVPVAPRAPEPAPKNPSAPSTNLSPAATPQSSPSAPLSLPKALGQAGAAGSSSPSPKAPSASGPFPSNSKGAPRAPSSILPPSGTTVPAASAIEGSGSASPWPPILIGLATGSLALGTTWWQVRRHAW